MLYFTFILLVFKEKLYTIFILSSIWHSFSIFFFSEMSPVGTPGVCQSNPHLVWGRRKTISHSTKTLQSFMKHNDYYCCAFILGSVLLLWKDTLTITTLIKEMFNWSDLYLQQFSPCKTWLEEQRHVGRHGSSEVAENFIPRVADSKKRETLGLAWTFEDPKAHPQWHTYSKQVTPTPTSILIRPCLVQQGHTFWSLN